jgi:photosystem II stability/assembly factor-like uncharacterized protein
MKIRLISLSVLALFVFASCSSNSTQSATSVTYSGVWNPTSSGTTDFLEVGQFVNSSFGFVAGTNGTTLSSSDSGTKWSLQSPAPVFSGSNAGTIYGLSFFNSTTGIAVGDQRDISLTTDGGVTWNAMDEGSVPQTDLIRSVYFTSRNNGFVGTTDAYGAASGSICTSTDGGQTWNLSFSTNGGIYNIDFNIPGSNGNNGVAQGRFGVSYWTANGGTSWNAGTTDQLNSIILRSTFTSATTGFAVANAITDNVHGNILQTNDGGHTWKTVYSVAEGLTGIANNGNGTITAVGFAGTVVESTDNGTTWTSSTVGTNRWADVCYASQHRAVLFGDNGSIETRDK